MRTWPMFQQPCTLGFAVKPSFACHVHKVLAGCVIELHQSGYVVLAEGFAQLLALLRMQGQIMIHKGFQVPVRR